MMQKAFTLIEVNLAILVMAGGILSIVVLYSLGFRESRQSREDLVSAAYADAVLGPLVGAMSATDLQWSTFDSVGNLPANGWGDFLDNDGTVRENTAAQSVFGTFGAPNNMPTDRKCGLVVSHEKGSGLIKIGFRASRKLDALLTAPLYYTEVRFQGVQQ